VRKFINKLFIIAALLLILTGCSQPQEVSAVVTNIRESNSNYECEKDSVTVIKTSNNRIDRLCGIYGNVGDTLSGYWDNDGFTFKE